MWPDYILLALATWRIARMLRVERGPGRVLERVRESAGIQHSDTGQVIGAPDTELGELLTCNYCLTMWVGAILALAYVVRGGLGRALSLPFALSAGALWFEKRVNR